VNEGKVGRLREAKAMISDLNESMNQLTIKKVPFDAARVDTSFDKIVYEPPALRRSAIDGCFGKVVPFT
jgi:hypothetical protein